MFADLHTCVLRLLVDGPLKIHILKGGESVQMKDVLEDIDFVYVYRGKVRVRMEHIYGKLGPRGSGTSKHRYSILERGDSLNPMNVA